MVLRGRAALHRRPMLAVVPPTVLDQAPGGRAAGSGGPLVAVLLHILTRRSWRLETDLRAVPAEAFPLPGGSGGSRWRFGGGGSTAPLVGDPSGRLPFHRPTVGRPGRRPLGLRTVSDRSGCMASWCRTPRRHEPRNFSANSGSSRASPPAPARASWSRVGVGRVSLAPLSSHLLGDLEPLGHQVDQAASSCRGGPHRASSAVTSRSPGRLVTRPTASRALVDLHVVASHRDSIRQVAGPDQNVQRRQVERCPSYSRAPDTHRRRP